MDRKDLDRPEYGSYEEVHEMLVRAMQDACMNDTSREYESPQIDMSFLYEDEKPKKTMVYKIIRSAAILFLAFGMLLGINAVLLTSDSNDVYGEKGLLHRIHEGVRGIFTDEDPSQYVEVDETGESCYITSLDELQVAKNYYPDLYDPENIPNDYEFLNLFVYNDIGSHYTAEYEYVSDEITLHINIKPILDDKGISNKNDYLIHYKDRIINIYWDNAYNSYVADIYMESLYICLYGIKDYQIVESIAKQI